HAYLGKNRACRDILPVRILGNGMRPRGLKLGESLLQLTPGSLDLSQNSVGLSEPPIVPGHSENGLERGNGAHQIAIPVACKTRDAKPINPRLLAEFFVFQTPLDDVIGKQGPIPSLLKQND